MSLVHIYAPEPDRVRRIVDPCPTCERKTRKVAVHTPWHGWAVTCCACGECWEDGTRCPRPFERGWRKKAAARAKSVWQSSRL